MERAGYSVIVHCSKARLTSGCTIYLVSFELPTHYPVRSSHTKGLNNSTFTFLHPIIDTLHFDLSIQWQLHVEFVVNLSWSFAQYHKAKNRSKQTKMDNNMSISQKMIETFTVGRVQFVHRFSHGMQLLMLSPRRPYAFARVEPLI